MKIDAIIWDYDGTLVNSVRKNIAVTIEVLKYFDHEITEHLPKELESFEAYSRANHIYKNWRYLYRDCFGISEKDLDEAGRLWTPEQLKNRMKPELFDGMKELVEKLSKKTVMGICSQNSSKNIRSMLEQYGIEQCFSSIIGVDEVSGEEQKPHPAGLIRCLKELEVKNDQATVVYIGDHSEDVRFGKNAEKSLKNGNLNVICVAIDHLGQQHLGKWEIEPDYMVKNTVDLGKLLIKLMN